MADEKYDLHRLLIFRLWKPVKGLKEYFFDVSEKSGMVADLQMLFEKITVFILTVADIKNSA